MMCVHPHGIARRTVNCRVAKQQLFCGCRITQAGREVPEPAGRRLQTRRMHRAV